MRAFLITIYDISNIEEHKILEEFVLHSDDKNEIQDKAYTIAYEKYPNYSRMVSIKEK